LKDEIEGEI
jgi:ABC-type multidrug transport system fused ATPase/permease subunit